MVDKVDVDGISWAKKVELCKAWNCATQWVLEGIDSTPNLEDVGGFLGPKAPVRGEGHGGIAQCVVHLVDMGMELPGQRRIELHEHPQLWRRWLQWFQLY